MRVLITGGTGYLGRAVVRAMAAAGHEPVVFARGASRAGLPGTAIDGDVRDRAALVRAAAGCDALWHGAALVSIWQPDPARFDAVNVGGLRHALDAARAHRLARVVYTSSFLARPPAGHRAAVRLNDYQRTKVEAALVARRARDEGAPVVILYPGVVYGPGEQTEGDLVGRLLRDHTRGRLAGVVGAERTWSFAWIDDVAAAHVAAIDRPLPATEYELGGENAPVMRLFEIAREVGLIQRLPRRLPYPVAALAGRIEELRARLTGRTPLVTRGAVDIFRHDWPLGSADAARDLGLRVTALAEGIARLVAAILD